jgi:gluconolactonase
MVDAIRARRGNKASVPMLVLILACASFGCLSAPAQQNSPIVKLDPALDEIVPEGAKLEKLADGYEFLEGPVWVRSGGYLLFSNKSEGGIDKWTPDGKVSLYLDLADLAKSHDRGNLSSGMTLDPQGRIVYCSGGERAVVRIEKNGQHTILAAQYEGKPLNPPNDLVYKSDGSLYFTAYFTDFGKRTEGDLPSSVYLLKNGKLQLVTSQLISPNGIALSPDEKYLYVNEIKKKTVWRFELQPDGAAINGRLLIDMSSENADGGPDGMRVDKKGNIYDSGPRGLWILSPEGKHLGTVLTPDKVSNLAFGDPDGKTLYITLHTALYRMRLKIEGVRP